LKNKPSYRKLAFNILRVIIPVGLLTFIFLKIDFQKLEEVFLTVNPWYFLTGIFFMNILQVITAGIRWHYMIRKGLRNWKVYRHISIYWSAMFYGYFVPSNVGMDVYRVAVAGKKQKNYEQHIAVLLGEKVYTLAITIALMFLAYIFVYPQVAGTEVFYSMEIFLIGIAMIALSLLVLYFLFRDKFTLIVDFIEEKFDKNIRQIAARLGSSVTFDFFAFRKELKYVAGQRFFHNTFFFTLLLRLWLVVGGYFLFLSFGISLPFWTLLFANTLFFLVFILPISFGSLGIREGAYIVIYGLFGVSAEVALAASFLALAGLVFTVSIGGLISLTENFTRIKAHHGE
jgi:glycosyltransferase 2 family protein